MKVLCILLAMSLCAAGAPADPGKAAIDFLEKVRLRKLNLEPGGDTALSAQTVVEKKRQIAKRLERMAGDLGSDPLEIGPIKTDDDFAAVLVRKVGGFDPGRLQVFAVALVKRGAEWIAAPMPASFENSGAGYGPSLRARLESLETWMLREQVRDLEDLREQSKERMRRKIETSLSAKELRGFGPEEAVDRFLTACETHDLASTLGLLGGLSAKLPDDWPARLKAADRAFSPESSGAWRLLTAPDIARVVTKARLHPSQKDNSRASISIACLDASGGAALSPRIRVWEISLMKTVDGLWRLDLPPAFLIEPASAENDHEGADPDTDQTDSFGIQWSARYPATHFPDPEQARKAWLDALGESTPRAMLKISKLKGPAGYSTKAALNVARIWWAVHDPTAPRHAIPLSFQAADSSAVALIQYFSPRDADRLDARAVYFEKLPGGWIYTPEPSPEALAKLGDWVDSETRLWPGKWQQHTLAACPKVRPDTMTAPDADTARKCVEDWIRAVGEGDFIEVLRQVACLGAGSGGTAALQNVSYEITGARRNKEVPTINGVHVGKFFTGVGLKVGHEGARIGSPFFAVVLTDKGPRVLAEIDLVAGGNRGRDYLNKTSFSRLEKGGSPEAVEDLRALFATHAAKVAEGVPKPGP